jgi:hypothetical protein
MGYEVTSVDGNAEEVGGLKLSWTTTEDFGSLCLCYCSFVPAEFWVGGGCC